MTLRNAYYLHYISDYLNHVFAAFSPAQYGRLNNVYNLNNVKVYGIEVELLRSFSHTINGYLNYVWQGYHTSALPFGTAETFFLSESLPKHKITFSLKYRLLEDTLLMLNGRWMYARKSMEGVTVPAFTTVNLGAEHTFRLRDRSNVTVSAFVDNIFDEDYEERFGYPMPGITVGGTIRFGFE